MISEGSCSGQFVVHSAELLTGKQMAEELVKQHSDPAFFNIDENGKDVE